MTDKITLSTLTSIEDVSALNANFTVLVDFINDEVLSRSNPNSATNQMEVDLDMNGYVITNAKVGDYYLTASIEAMQTVVTECQTYATNAATSAANAETTYQNTLELYNSFETNNAEVVAELQQDVANIISSFEQEQTAILADAGYNVVGTFADGCTVTTRAEAVYYAGDETDSYKYEGFYVWTGSFSKTVTAGTTPFDETGWMLAATGYTKETGAIALFGKTIDVSQSIPSTQNALSINPTVGEDAEVTVSETSSWYIIGSTN